MTTAFYTLDKNKRSNTNQSCREYITYAQKLEIFSVVFHCWFDQNNSKIQLINPGSLTFLDFEVMFIRLQNVGTLE